jgi:hypothetical protein
VEELKDVGVNVTAAPTPPSPGIPSKLHVGCAKGDPRERRISLVMDFTAAWDMMRDGML